MIVSQVRYHCCRPASAHTDSMPGRLDHIVADAHDLSGLARFRAQAPGNQFLPTGLRTNLSQVRVTPAAWHAFTRRVKAAQPLPDLAHDHGFAARSLR